MLGARQVFNEKGVTVLHQGIPSKLEQNIIIPNIDRRLLLAELRFINTIKDIIVGKSVQEAIDLIDLLHHIHAAEGWEDGDRLAGELYRLGKSQKELHPRGMVAVKN